MPQETKNLNIIEIEAIERSIFSSMLPHDNIALHSTSQQARRSKAWKPRETYRLLSEKNIERRCKMLTVLQQNNKMFIEWAVRTTLLKLFW